MRYVIKYPILLQLECSVDKEVGVLEPSTVALCDIDPEGGGEPRLAVELERYSTPDLPGATVAVHLNAEQVAQVEDAIRRWRKLNLLA